MVGKFCWNLKNSHEEDKFKRLDKFLDFIQYYINQNSNKQ